MADLRLVDAIYRDLYTRTVELVPLPLWYRLSPATLREIAAEWKMPAEHILDRPGNYGRIWGVPYIVSDAAPAGEVQFTTDYQTWQKLDLRGGR